MNKKVLKTHILSLYLYLTSEHPAISQFAQQSPLTRLGQLNAHQTPSRYFDFDLFTHFANKIN